MKFFDTHITQEAKDLVLQCLNSGHVSEGELVKQFEQKVEQEFGYKNCVAVNSGTSALHLALLLSGVQRGDEVILPAQTFVATGLAILYCGAVPVFADINMDGDISVDSVSEKITNKTRAVIGVAWGGNPCDLEALDTLCDDNDLMFIQDNAQAFGATYNSNPITAYSDFSCFSFQAIKPLTTGDGGLLVCDLAMDYPEAKELRWFGISKENDLPDITGERQYNLDVLGYKYHMNDFSAALGLGNLVGVHNRQSIREAIAFIYDHEIKVSVGTPKKEGSSNWLYTMLVDNRNDFLEMMKSKAIPVSVVHMGIDRNRIFGGVDNSLWVQRYWDEHHVCLPCHAGLTDEDVQKIVDAVNGGW